MACYLKSPSFNHFWPWALWSKRMECFGIQTPLTCLLWLIQTHFWVPRKFFWQLKKTNEDILGFPILFYHENVCMLSVQYSSSVFSKSSPPPPRFATLSPLSLSWRTCGIFVEAFQIDHLFWLGNEQSRYPSQIHVYKPHGHQWLDNAKKTIRNNQWIITSTLLVRI